MSNHMLFFYVAVLRLFYLIKLLYKNENLCLS